MLAHDEVVEAINRVTARHNYLMREHGSETQEHSRLMAAEFGLSFEALMEVLYFSVVTNLENDPADIITEHPWLPAVMRHCVWMGISLGQRGYELIHEQGDDPKDDTIRDLRQRIAVMEHEASTYQTTAKTWKQASVSHHDHALELVFCSSCLSAGVIESQVMSKKSAEEDGPA